MNSKKSSKNIYALVTRLEVKVQTHIKDRWGLKDSYFELILTTSMLCPLKLRMKNIRHLVHLEGITLYCMCS